MITADEWRDLNEYLRNHNVSQSLSLEFDTIIFERHGHTWEIQSKWLQTVDFGTFAIEIVKWITETDTPINKVKRKKPEVSLGKWGTHEDGKG